MEKIEILKKILNADNPKSCAAKMMAELDSEEMKKAIFNSRIDELLNCNPVDAFTKYRRDKKQAYAVTEVYSAAAAWRDIIGWQPEYGKVSYYPLLLSDGTFKICTLRGRDYLAFPTEEIALNFAEKYKGELVIMEKLKELRS